MKIQSNEILKYPVWLWFIISSVLSIGILFYHLNEIPIVVWDEARLANNALEMAKTGLSLITTYDWVPDHWNTKPPLLIWLMSISIQVFGQNELGVRIPSVLATLLTVYLIFWFSVYHIKKPFVGFLSVLILFTDFKFIQEHGARSGDYDALLTLWTTCFLLSIFLFLQSNKPRTSWLTLAMLSLLLAFFTKSIQGLIFLPGVFIYVLYIKRLYFFIKNPFFYIYIFIFIATCTIYYFQREQIDPGYFQDMFSNDFGRYKTVIEAHKHGYFFYINILSLASLLSLVFQVLKGKDNESKNLSIYLGIVAFSYLLVISLASTKLPWYVYPISPLNSLIIALYLEYLISHFIDNNKLTSNNISSILIVSCIFSGIIVFIINIIIHNRNLNNLKSSLPDQYSFFLRKNVNNDIRKFIVIHPGYENNVNNKKMYYVAPTIFYIKSLLNQGFDIKISSFETQENYDNLLLCGESTKNEVEKKLSLNLITSDTNCGIYSISHWSTTGDIINNQPNFQDNIYGSAPTAHFCGCRICQQWQVTRREKFLDQLEKLLAWLVMLAVIEPH